MAESARRIRPEPPPQPVDEVDGDCAYFKARPGLKVDSWQVNVDKDDEWHTVTYTVSRRRRKRDS